MVGIGLLIKLWAFSRNPPGLSGSLRWEGASPFFPSPSLILCTLTVSLYFHLELMVTALPWAQLEFCLLKTDNYVAWNKQASSAPGWLWLMRSNHFGERGVGGSWASEKHQLCTGLRAIHQRLTVRGWPRLRGVSGSFQLHYSLSPYANQRAVSINKKL